MIAKSFSDESRLVRVSEVARHLSISRSKLYLMMEAGDLPFVKFGKSRRVPLEAVEKLVKESLVIAG